jgi:hypothetical protein
MWSIFDSHAEDPRFPDVLGQALDGMEALDRCGGNFQQTTALHADL